MLCNLQLLRNRKWEGPITHRSRKQQKLSWLISFRFPYVQIIDQQALILSGWARQQSCYALEKFEGASSKQSRDNDYFLRYGHIRSYLPEAIIWIFFPLRLYNIQHVAYQKKANCILFLILDPKLVLEWCSGTKWRIAIHPLYRRSIPVLFLTTD